MDTDALHGHMSTPSAFRPTFCSSGGDCGAHSDLLTSFRLELEQSVGLNALLARMSPGYASVSRRTTGQVGASLQCRSSLTQNPWASCNRHCPSRMNAQTFAGLEIS